ncbi:hypothetical protein B296_00033042 [Ensete ventricosum]|uniref:Uncharacterized protein n=1 Tax=Ensete ventricosum TaxID=4639 RepID=A0A426X2A6_ENSVE|nr:hypothetical protein B296_00033042 [Ensete ventricosum]
MHRVDAVGKSSGVRRELAEGIGSLPGWCKGVRQKKIETCWKIVGVAEKLLGFARIFAERIKKLTGNTPGDHREKIERLVTSIPKAIGLAKIRS